MEQKRRNERIFDYAVLGATVFIFVTIIEVMSRASVKPEVLTVLGSALGIDLGFIGLAASHLWNTQKKDEAAARTAVPTVTTTASTTNISSTTAPVVEPKPTI